MKYFADLHVHSKHSIATAKNLDLENLYAAARIKGIGVVGTGDITHPGWLSEIKEKLEPAEPGLFKLKEAFASQSELQIPKSCQKIVRFILQGEISNIYKKNGRTRKNHSVVLIPDLESACRFSERLAKIGNIRSDGRPILGIDVKEIVKILLDVSEEAILIPAHIWTPWFSVLGSKSGFDSVEECFEELSSHIFAVETGLSSDPPMNWRISHLDRMMLVSNSDAHSPSSLGRNANWFDTDLSFSALRTALKEKTPSQCLGTIDMYPQEGKYHYDGHRKCGICFHPRETMNHKGICPVCGKSLTIGVLYRVEELADRPEGIIPDHAIPNRYIIPLPEILAEIMDRGASSKKVQEIYYTAVNNLGPELDILLDFPEDLIDTAGIPLLSEAVRRMRSGSVILSSGYDGEYGRVTLFQADEKDAAKGQRILFSALPSPKSTPEQEPNRCTIRSEEIKKGAAKVFHEVQDKKAEGESENLNAEQHQAVIYEGRQLCIIAGPGAGKTQTLTRRIAHAIHERNITPGQILAVTFTHKAAREMKDRLKSLLGSQDGVLPNITTFHGFCYQILQDYPPNFSSVSDEEHGTLQDSHSRRTHCFRVIDDMDRGILIGDALKLAHLPNHLKGLTPDALLDKLILAKQRLISAEDDIRLGTDDADAVSAVYAIYQKLLAKDHLLDYDDLILNVVKRLETDDEFLRICRQNYPYVYVDEFQDINEGQYRIVKALSHGEVCVIGDPDQSIYGFRGSDFRFFDRFRTEHPTVHTIYLSQNYRSTKTILEASHHVIRNHTERPEGVRVYSNIDGIKTVTICSLANENAEAVAIGKMIESMIGGSGFHSIDFGKVDETGIQTDRSFSDFAILFRTNAQSQPILDFLEKAGIPCQTASKLNLYGRRGIAELLSYLKLIEGAGMMNDLKRILQTKRYGVSDSAYLSFLDRYSRIGAALDDILSTPQLIHDIADNPQLRSALSAISETILHYRRHLQSKPIDEKLLTILHNTGIQEEIRGNKKTEEALQKVISIGTSSGTNANEFFKSIVLESDPDTVDIRSEKVSLMTMHSSKGLEFPVVFIAGCEDGFIPYRRSETHEPDAAEERRLLYVAMTRAKERLILTYAGNRTIFGKQTVRRLSPFVQDIESQFIQVEKHLTKTKPKNLHKQINLFT